MIFFFELLELEFYDFYDNEKSTTFLFCNNFFYLNQKTKYNCLKLKVLPLKVETC